MCMTPQLIIQGCIQLYGHRLCIPDLNPLAACMLLGPGITQPAKEEINLELYSYSLVITIAANSNAEVENMKSDVCVGFTQLQRK